MLVNDDNDIYLYHYDGNKYSLVRKIHLPDDVNDYINYRKVVSSTGVFLQNPGDITHHLSTTDLHPIGELHHNGRLRGVLYPSSLMYIHKRAQDDFIIILHNQPDGEMILQPPHGHKWDYGLSVCKCEEYVIVVERFTKSMDVFSTRGNIPLLFCHILVLI